MVWFPPKFRPRKVGTGPFAYESRQPNQSVTLKAFPGYYGGQPSIDRVAFLVAPDDRVAEEAIKNGELPLQ